MPTYTFVAGMKSTDIRVCTYTPDTTFASETPIGIGSAFDGACADQLGNYFCAYNDWIYAYDSDLNIRSDWGDSDTGYFDNGANSTYDIIAMKVNPVTGDLYFADNHDDGVWVVDANGDYKFACNLSGASFYTLANMEFTSDGAYVLLPTQNGTIVTCDCSDGSFVSSFSTPSGDVIEGVKLNAANDTIYFVETQVGFKAPSNVRKYDYPNFSSQAWVSSDVGTGAETMFGLSLDESLVYISSFTTSPNTNTIKAVNTTTGAFDYTVSVLGSSPYVNANHVLPNGYVIQAVITSAPVHVFDSTLTSVATSLTSSDGVASGQIILYKTTGDVYPPVVAALVGSTPSFFLDFEGDAEVDDFRVLSDPPRQEVEEGMGWLTDIIKPDHSDDEQRIALRINPRQTFEYDYVIQTLQRRRELQALFSKYLKKKWGIAVWTESQLSGVAIPASTSVISVDTRYADFRANSFGVIWEHESLWEAIRITSKTDSSITLTYPTLNTYTASAFIMPMRKGYVKESPRVAALKNDSTLINIKFESIENVRLTGYSAAQTYDGLEVVTRGALIESKEGVDETHNPALRFLDNLTGLLGIQSNTDFNVVTQQHKLRYSQASTIWDFRKWLHSLYGRQNPFLVPSYNKDLALTRAVGSSDTIIYFENVRLSYNVTIYDLLQYVAFLNSDGTVRVRKISSIAEVDSSEEKITLTSTVGAAYTTSTTLMFVWRCRLGSDDISLRWQERNHLTCENGFIRITQ